jgi:ATP-dependent protease ClpP protease subunit
LARDVIALLLFLQHEDARQPLSLRIESPGGTFGAGMAIVETIRRGKPGKPAVDRRVLRFEAF